MVMAYPILQKELHGKIFVRGSLSSKLEKSVKLLLALSSIVIYSSQVVQEISVRQNAVLRQRLL